MPAALAPARQSEPQATPAAEPAHPPASAQPSPGASNASTAASPADLPTQNPPRSRGQPQATCESQTSNADGADRLLDLAVPKHTSAAALAGVSPALAAKLETSANGKAVYADSAETLQAVWMVKKLAQLTQSDPNFKPTTELLAELQQRAQSVQGFFDADTGQIYAARFKGGAKAEKIMHGATLAHENAHRLGGDELTSWLKSDEYLRRNGYVFEVQKNGEISILQVAADDPRLEHPAEGLIDTLKARYGADWDEQRLAAVIKLARETNTPLSDLPADIDPKLRKDIQSALLEERYSEAKIFLDHAYGRAMSSIDALTIERAKTADLMHLERLDLEMERQFKIAAALEELRDKWISDYRFSIPAKTASAPNAHFLANEQAEIDEWLTCYRSKETVRGKLQQFFEDLDKCRSVLDLKALNPEDGVRSSDVRSWYKLENRFHAYKPDGASGKNGEVWDLEFTAGHRVLVGLDKTDPAHPKWRVLFVGNPHGSGNEYTDGVDGIVTRYLKKVG